jgi:hypothetical protein
MVTNASVRNGSQSSIDSHQEIGRTLFTLSPEGTAENYPGRQSWVYLQHHLASSIRIKEYLQRMRIVEVAMAGIENVERSIPHHIPNGVVMTLGVGNSLFC